MECLNEIELESTFDSADTDNQTSTSLQAWEVDIDTSEYEQEEVNTTHTPRNAGLRQLKKRTSFKKRDSDEIDKAETKRTKFTYPENVYGKKDISISETTSNITTSNFQF